MWTRCQNRRDHNLPSNRQGDLKYQQGAPETWKTSIEVTQKKWHKGMANANDIGTALPTPI